MHPNADHEGGNLGQRSAKDSAQRDACPKGRALLCTLNTTYGRQIVWSDNGPEFVATAPRKWFARLSVKTLFITPGCPWENGYCESFNGRLRDELLNGELCYPLREAQVVIEN